MKGIISIQSHVVFGHAGNSSAVFPLQRMGMEVWPIHTVQFSNHTQYAQGWKGRAFSADDINQLVTGIDNIGKLADCQAVLSGYQGSAEQCQAIINTVEQVKQQNPAALYVCDPVMGDPEKGCILADGITEQLINEVMPIADVIVPNQFELAQFTQMEITNIEQAKLACKKALSLGPKVVLVKHLHSLSDDMFSMMLATESGFYLTQRPQLEFAKQPVGVGDLISALFTGSILNGASYIEAFEHATNACFGVLEYTQKSQQWELQTVAAQAELVAPSSNYQAIKL